MSACEECWTEASRRAQILGGSTAEHYYRVLSEVLATPRSWRDGLDALDALLDDCAQGGDDDPHAAVRVWAVRAVVNSIREFEDDTDEDIRQALMEEWIIEGGADE